MSSFPRSTRFIQVTTGFMTKVTSMRASGSTRSLLISSFPVEGVVISLHHEALKNPGLITTDPYRNGWVCVVKAPEL